MANGATLAAYVAFGALAGPPQVGTRILAFEILHFALFILCFGTAVFVVGDVTCIGGKLCLASTGCYCSF